MTQSCRRSGNRFASLIMRCVIYHILILRPPPTPLLLVVDCLCGGGEGGEVGGRLNNVVVYTR